MPLHSSALDCWLVVWFRTTGRYPSMSRDLRFETIPVGISAEHLSRLGKLTGHRSVCGKCLIFVSTFEHLDELTLCDMSSFWTPPTLRKIMTHRVDRKMMQQHNPISLVALDMQYITSKAQHTPSSRSSTTECGGRGTYRTSPANCFLL